MSWPWFFLIILNLVFAETTPEMRLGPDGEDLSNECQTGCLDCTGWLCHEWADQYEPTVFGCINSSTPAESRCKAGCASCTPDSSCTMCRPGLLMRNVDGKNPECIKRCNQPFVDIAGRRSKFSESTGGEPLSLWARDPEDPKLCRLCMVPGCEICDEWASECQRCEEGRVLAIRRSTTPTDDPMQALEECVENTTVSTVPPGEVGYYYTVLNGQPWRLDCPWQCQSCEGGDVSGNGSSCTPNPPQSPTCDFKCAVGACDPQNRHRCGACRNFMVATALETYCVDRCPTGFVADEKRYCVPGSPDDHATNRTAEGPQSGYDESYTSSDEGAEVSPSDLQSPHHHEWDVMAEDEQGLLIYWGTGVHGGALAVAIVLALLQIHFRNVVVIYPANPPNSSSRGVGNSDDGIGESQFSRAVRQRSLLDLSRAAESRLAGSSEV
ncbi:unnamed protein product, partial [Mesorhabditis spiculigera]